MNYAYLGRSGLRVSTVCLGTMNFGATTGEAEARKIVDHARANGVNFVDTADAYAGGKSETILGRLLKKDRDDWVLASKVGQQDGPPECKQGLSRKWMMRAIDASLERLKTDYIDIYLMHHVDWSTPLEESITAMGDLIASGKVHHWGFSNHRGWQIAELVRICDQLSVPHPIVAQPLYNIVNRQAETDILPACEYFGIGVIPYSPLARGVLTGKYDPTKKTPANSRAGRGDHSILSRDWQKEAFRAVDRIRKQCDGRDITPVDFAMQWLLNNAIITSVIAGPRTLSQWKAYIKSVDVGFTAKDEELVDSLVSPGHPATPGYNWPMYAPRGRKPVVS